MTLALLASLRGSLYSPLEIVVLLISVDFGATGGWVGAPTHFQKENNNGVSKQLPNTCKGEGGGQGEGSGGGRGLDVIKSVSDEV